MANSSSTHAPDVRRDTILVVDDTPETLGFLTDTLDHAGFTALIATDGESALRLIEQITPDLVLMDAVMPGLNGFETCRRMKRNKMFGGLPVMVGANGPRMLRLTAELADQWNGGLPGLDEVPEMLQDMDDACRAVGRDPATISRSAEVLVRTVPAPAGE